MLSRWHATTSLHRRATHRDVPLIPTSRSPQRMTDLKNLRTLRESSGPEFRCNPQVNAVKDSREAFSRVLPPLPHIRCRLRSGLHWGGEGRGEGD